MRIYAVQNHGIRWPTNVLMDCFESLAKFCEILEEKMNCFYKMRVDLNMQLPCDYQIYYILLSYIQM